MVVEVIHYRDEYQPDFEALNREWLERYFEVERTDLLYLRNPRGKIVDPGGQVFIAVEEGSVLGTCAMIRHSDEIYELSKMAVTQTARGRGLGNALMDAALAWTREKGAHKIVLESNTAMEPAIKLYEKYGFVTTRLGPTEQYTRSNIEMELEL